MNADKFLFVISQYLSSKQLEHCGLIDFLKTGIVRGEVRPLSHTLTDIISNLENIINNHEQLIVDSKFGICCNYSNIFRNKNEPINFDFYALNEYFSIAIGCHTGYPIPISSGGLWQGDNLKYRILYMQWIVRHLHILKSHLSIE